MTELPIVAPHPFKKNKDAEPFAWGVKSKHDPLFEPGQVVKVQAKTGKEWTSVIRRHKRTFPDGMAIYSVEDEEKRVEISASLLDFFRDLAASCDTWDEARAKLTAFVNKHERKKPTPKQEPPPPPEEVDEGPPASPDSPDDEVPF